MKDYKLLSNKYKPDNIKLIFLLESPPANGAYFYDKDSIEHEWLYKAMMQIIGFDYLPLCPETKRNGLLEFQDKGFYLIDATYNPVNTINDKNQRNIAIMESFDDLIKDLEGLNCKENNIPIIVVKANIFALFNSCLKSKGYNIINENILVPFPSHGQQGKFQQRINEIFTCRKILEDDKLSSHYLSYGIPKEYVINRNNIKAIILGADPSNFSNNGETVKVKTVFDLGGNDKRYFSSILTNIGSIGLNLGNIYVQNIVRNFMTEETSNNKLWRDFAEIWKPNLKQDIDSLDPKKKLPVFATAECILNILLKDDVKKIPASKYFEDKIVIKAEQNYLERILIPCFRRNYPYLMYPEYKDYIKQFVC